MKNHFLSHTPSILCGELVGGGWMTLAKCDFNTIELVMLATKGRWQKGWINILATKSR